MDRLRCIHGDGYTSPQVEARLAELRVAAEPPLEAAIMCQLFDAARAKYGGLQAVAVIAGLNQDTVRFWERRRRLNGPRLRDVLSVFQVLGCTLEVRKLREDEMDYRRSTKPGELSEGISPLHDYVAAARSRARQEQTLPRDAECDEVQTRKRERDRERYRRQSQPRTKWNVPTEAEREEACALSDPVAHLDRPRF